MRLYLFHFILLLLGITGLTFVGLGTRQGVLSSMVGGFIGGAIGFLANEIMLRPAVLRLVLWGAFHPGATVRVSVAAIMRIEVDGRLLLVYSEKNQQFQPVGGALKLLPSHRTPFPVESDPKYQTPRSDNELRFAVTGMRLPQLLRWVLGETDRELSPWREFWEELIDAGPLNAAEFPYVMTRFLKRDIPTPSWAPEAQCYQLRIAEVYEVTLTEAQQQAIREAENNRADKSREGQLKLFSIDEVRRLGHTVPIRIGDHSQLILEN